MWLSRFVVACLGLTILVSCGSGERWAWAGDGLRPSTVSLSSDCRFDGGGTMLAATTVSSIQRCFGVGSSLTAFLR